MAEDQDVRIVAWPEEAALVAHGVQDGVPVPVRLSFDDTPVQVTVTNDDEPLSVDMKMRVSAAEPVPLCITVCEPICATSDYTVGISVFDNPFASIRVRGETKIAPCEERPPPKEHCADMRQLELEGEYARPFSHQGVRFVPLGDPLRVVTWGEPAGEAKLAFPDAGVRMEWSRPVRNVRLTLGAAARPELTLTAHGEEGRIGEYTESIDNQTRTVTVPATGVTALDIRGGENEAFLVDVCMTPEQV